MIGYIVGLAGCWIFADGISSLYTYTGDSPKAKGQKFWRDHSLRIIRCLVGILLIKLGSRNAHS